MVFGFLFGNKPERLQKSAEKFGNVLKNKVTTKEQRLEAIEVLKEFEDGTISIPQLLKRFEIVVDSGIQDKREKEMCLERIVSFGEVAKPFAQQALERAERIAWPIKLAEELFPKEEFCRLLVNALGKEFSAFDESANQRNAEIILALKECVDAGTDEIVSAVEGFLGSRDENVRMAALECLESHASINERAKQIIVSLLNTTAHDDNSRFLGVVQTIVKNKGWNASVP